MISLPLRTLQVFCECKAQQFPDQAPDPDQLTGGTNVILERPFAKSFTRHLSHTVLISVNGKDRPGITSSLANVLADYPVTVLDIDQSVIHDQLSWGMLVEVDDSACGSNGKPDALFKDLLFKAHELDLGIDFTPVEQDALQQWQQDGAVDRYIVTLLGRSMDATLIARLTEIISKHDWNIATIQRISERQRKVSTDDNPLIAVEIRIHHSHGNVDELRRECLSLASNNQVDIALQQDSVWRRNRRLVCFDMDSTLIQSEVIDLMAEAAGVGSEVSAITESAMRGELDFNQSFTRRMALLEGMPISHLEQIDRDLKITDGAETLVKNLRMLGYKTAIISGGFQFFASRLAERLGIDYVYANELDSVDGKLTGKVKGDIINEKRKAELVRQIAAIEGIQLEQVIAVGDGANDIPMLSLAGLGIAFHAKPLVRDKAKNSFGTVGLDGILYLIGMRENEIKDT